jgi:hypothetical protein
MAARNERYYHWDEAKLRIGQNFTEALLRGEHVAVSEEESSGIFGKPIGHAMQGSCILESGTDPKTVVPTIPRHLGLMGYSSRVVRRHGRRCVEIWLPNRGTPATVREQRVSVASVDVDISTHVGRRSDIERVYDLLSARPIASLQKGLTIALTANTLSKCPHTLS